MLKRASRLGSMVLALAWTSRWRGKRLSMRLNLNNWSSVKAVSGLPPSAKWVKAPVRLSAFDWDMASSTRRSSSSVRTPTRFMPVSILMCTSTGRPAASAAFLVARMCDGVNTAMVRRFSAAARAPSALTGPKIRMGSVMPAARRSIPSSAMATPSQSAPAASAALATGTAPWP